MIMKLLFLAGLLLGLFHSTWAKKDKCHGNNILSCTECIQREPACAWCTDPASKTRNRCHTPERLLKIGCAETHIYHPQGSVQVVRNHSRAEQTEAQPAFLQPQTVNITLRPGAPQSFNLTVFLAKDQLTSELTMDFSPIPAGIHITYATISTQNPMVIQVDVELTQCPGEKKQNSTIHMTPRDSSLTLDLQLTLECSCDCAGERMENSNVCNGRGALVCGGCECNQPYGGNHCESEPRAEEHYTMSEDDYCRSGPGSAVCSGRGDCVERDCVCNERENQAERYSGKYCECSNFDCPTTGWNRWNMKLCGGHGDCVCGRCICHRNWTGEDCSCLLDSSGCLASNGQVCAGRGNCVCGACTCTDSKFLGPTCEDCPTCPGLCVQHRQCVECRAYGTGSMKSSCEEECSYLNLTKVDSRDVLLATPGYPGVDVYHCKERDENDCWYYYTLTPSGDQARVTKDRECDTNPPWNPFGWGM